MKLLTESDVVDLGGSVRGDVAVLEDVEDVAETQRQFEQLQRHLLGLILVRIEDDEIVDPANGVLTVGQNARPGTGSSRQLFQVVDGRLQDHFDQTSFDLQMGSVEFVVETQEVDAAEDLTALAPVFWAAARDAPPQQDQVHAEHCGAEVLFGVRCGVQDQS